MAIVGYEWLIAGALILLLLSLGPKKLPELARSIAQARHELHRDKDAE